MALWLFNASDYILTGIAGVLYIVSLSLLASSAVLTISAATRARRTLTRTSPGSVSPSATTFPSSKNMASYQPLPTGKSERPGVEQ